MCQRGAPRRRQGPPFCGGDTYVLGPCSLPLLWFAVAYNITVEPQDIKSQLRSAGEDCDGPTVSGGGGTAQLERPRPLSWIRAFLAGVGPAVRLPTWSGAQGPALPTARTKLPACGVQFQQSCHVTATRVSEVPAYLDSGRGHGPHLFMGEVAKNSRSSFNIATRLGFRGHGHDPNELCSESASTWCCPYVSRGPRDGGPTYSGPAVDTD